MGIWKFSLVALALVVPANVVLGGLIFNGDFELGNVGFTTQYTYTTDISEPRTIVVGIDPQRYNPRAVSYGDHTLGFGRMLIANGAAEDDIVIWEQTVSVTPNTEYVFSYWLSNWTDNDIRLAQIKCLINNVLAGIGWAPAATGEWTFVFHRWNSGSNTQATIRLVNKIRAEVSNDFAIDDIDMFDIGDNCLLVAYSTRGGSIMLPGEGVFLYPQGESVDLEARCESGYEFAGWGGNFSEPGHLLQISMSSDRQAIAQFKKLDYSANIRASGAAPSEFATCAESADRLAVFQGALDSLSPRGLVLGERTGVCVATYLFPILQPKGGVRDITKVAVNVYGGLLSGGPAVKVGDGSYVRIRNDVHLVFTGKAVMDLLGQPEGSLYWLPVEVNATVGALDLADVYVSYDCASISKSLLRRFHDHLSIYQALDNYARAQDIRDLFNLRANRKAAWEAVVQTSALAEDLGVSSEELQNAIGACIEGFDDLLLRWLSLGDSSNPAILAGCNSEAIVASLDAAVRSGRSYIAAYAEAIADGAVLADEVSQLNRSVAEWKQDMSTLTITMAEVFRTLGEVNRTAASSQLRDTAEKVIRAMAPWHTGEPDDYGFWTPASPTYLEEISRTLQDFPAEDITLP